ncbi:MAG: ATP-dependent RecD-like DNA helicase [Deltaproteobacteria bacterium]|nr:ATP-dependent RecD-like DNA helicase [Deltaproteobacteria bacterium]MCL5278030.1 ATP-dependent RecD-like DNA helicase [Deltaproteobacteria bacterium]
MFIEIKGTVERVTYYNAENNYTIAKLKVSGRHDLVTAAGTLFSVSAGEVLKLKGYWEYHPKFGEQFKVMFCESVVPATVTGIERYLGSGLVKGIGPATAKRIVSKFGIDTLNIIETDIRRLTEVAGIGDKRIEMIGKAWEDQKGIREVMVFLQGYGVSPAYGVKIYKQYGKDAIKVIKENPYRLASDVFGIGFLTADKISEKMGIAKDSQMRAEAGILYVLYQLSDNGHVYYPYESLVDECVKILDTGKEPIISALGKIATDKKIVIEDLNGESDRAVYLAKFHVSEVSIARRLTALMQFPKKLKPFNIDKAIEWIQGQLKIRLAEGQEQAVKEAIKNKVMVVTGGPGTGKTTLINSIIRIYNRLGQEVVLAAPTGRAAKRMSEATGSEAKTIHRLLEFSPKDSKFKRDDQNPLEADLVVIDEASMVDTVLMHHFLKAVPKNATLILVGDVDQLPSVGAGNVLKDIIDSGCIPTVRLTEIFRQAKESLIVVNAHKVNHGQMLTFEHSEDQPQDFYLFKIEEPEKVLEKIIELCREKIPGKFGYRPVEDIQVITPMHKGIVGTTNLNAELQKHLNSSKDEIVRGGKVLKVRDKVMQIRNDYDKDVFNGDIGLVKKIDREEQKVVVDYDGRLVSYEYSELDEIVLAYAISVHKAQGSEYPVVVMPVLIQHYMLLQRNLLYTGITRGKKLVVLVGTKKAIAIAIRNNKPQKRYTYLQNRLSMKQNA